MKNKKCSICQGEYRVYFNKIYSDYLCLKHRRQIYKCGHILERTHKDPNPYKIIGDVVEITLFDKDFNIKGFLIIDLIDFDVIKKYKWGLTKNGYVHTKSLAITCYVHQLILGVFGHKKEIDHYDRNKLNNRQSNLRLITISQNGHNNYIRKTNTSGCVGVSFYKNYNKWEAYITVNYKFIKLGYFNNINDAINARKAAEEKYIDIKIYPR
jgi:hypothetical protein